LIFSKHHFRLLNPPQQAAHVQGGPSPSVATMGAGYKILKLIIRNDAMKEE
jgi:hypothetical protein